MRNLDNVCSEMEEIFPEFKFNLQPEINRFRKVLITGSDDRSMMIEIELDYPNDSAVICVLENHGFRSRTLSMLLNRFVEELD